MWTSAVRVNGVEHDDSITLYCSESEPLLNNDLIRQQLLAVLDSSNANNPDPLQRHERYFLILKDTVTPDAEPYLLIYQRGENDVCFATTSIPPPSWLPPNTRILAHGHDHPSEPNQNVMCVDSTGAATIPGKTVNGADQGDRDWANRVNDTTANPIKNTGWLPMSGYIIDKHNVFVLRPGEKVGDEHNAGNKFNWDGLSPTDGRTARRCKWPKKVVP
jgi:hypothetical protein